MCLKDIKDRDRNCFLHQIRYVTQNCAKMVVENAFGRLKGRFRLLRKPCDCDLPTTIRCV